MPEFRVLQPQERDALAAWLLSLKGAERDG
jgi:hypothetical protein